MARKLDCDARIAYICTVIYEWEAFAKKGNEHAGIVATRIRNALSMGDKEALARLEEKYAKEAVKWRKKIQDAAEATRIFYNRYPERDQRTDYQIENSIPLKSDTADIIANFIDGGQQTTKGRLLSDRLKEIINPKQQKWLEIRTLTQEEFKEIEDFLRPLVS